MGLSRLTTCAAAVLALIVTADPADAAGNPVGKDVTNTATVTYRVDGIAQPPLFASDTFTVHRELKNSPIAAETKPAATRPAEASASGHSHDPLKRAKSKAVAPTPVTPVPKSGKLAEIAH